MSPQVNSSRSSSPGVIPPAPPSPNPGSSLPVNQLQRSAAATGISKSSLSDVPCASLVRQVSNPIQFKLYKKFPADDYFRTILLHLIISYNHLTSYNLLWQIHFI